MPRAPAAAASDCFIMPMELTSPTSSRPRGRGLGFVKTAFACALALVFAAAAHASHFRGASLTWKRLASPANTVEVTVTESWRVSPGNSYSWGDGTVGFSTSGATVIASGSDASGSFLVVRKVVTHTYPTEGPWTIHSTGGARIAFVNSNQTNWTLDAVVDLRGGNQGSPVISSPIVLQMVKGGLNTVPLSFADVDGDAVTFRMATTLESSISSVANAGGHTLSVSTNGVLSWDTSGTSIGQFYAVQVIANDNHSLTPSGVGTSKVFFDFMILIVDGSLNRPPVASGNAGPFIAAIGQPFTNVITGTDPDGGNLTVTHLGLPNGATLTPASGTGGPQPLNATFAWTPTLADAGSSVGVTIVFTDSGGLQATKSFSISVPSNQPPLADAGPDQTFYDVDGNNTPIVVSLNGSGSYDPEHVPITYAWTQTGGPAVALANANTATPTFNAPNLQNHPSGEPAPAQLTFRLAVSDGNSTRTDDVTIVVKHNNLPPVAVAAAPATANEGSAIVLDGSASTDADGDPLVFTWTQTGGTSVVLGGNGTNNPQLTFSHMISAPHAVAGETLTFVLTVSDGIASSPSAPVQVFVQNVNQAPTVDAGDGDTVFDNVGRVDLAGAGFDHDGDTLSYSWAQVAGPAVTLLNANSANASFIAPAVSPEQGSVTLTFQCTVSDATGSGDTAALTGANTVDILVRHANRAPIADAGVRQTVPELTLVSLDGTGSYDPDNDTLSYSWTQTSGPAVELNGAGTARPSFTAPNVGPEGTTLTFALAVTDVPRDPLSGAALTSAPQSASVIVQYVNQPPTVQASSPLTKDEGTAVALQATAQDPDGNPLTFTWVQTSGPAVTLSQPNTATPSFTAPLVPFGGGTVGFKVTVDDGFGGTASAPVVVNITNVNNPPVADAGLNLATNEGSAVALNGLYSSDLDGEALTYTWTQTAGPAVTLTGAQTATPSFTAPLINAGGDPLASVTLTFRLTVKDIPGDSSSDTVDVKVANVDHTPLADAGGSKNAGEATTVTLSALASSDPDGDPLTYSWTQISGPPVALTGANTATPSFTAPFVGATGTSLGFKVVVSDPFGGAASDTASVAVFNTNTPPTVANATASTASLWPPNHAMVPISIVGVLDPENNATITITSVTQDEPTNGLGDGDTPVDAILQGSTVLIRSERSGKGNGRVYHIHFKASDFEGSAVGVVTVSVPKDKRGDAAIDGGELYDSTQ